MTRSKTQAEDKKIGGFVFQGNCFPDTISVFFSPYFEPRNLRCIHIQIYISVFDFQMHFTISLYLTSILSHRSRLLSHLLNPTANFRSCIYKQSRTGSISKYVFNFVVPYFRPIRSHGISPGLFVPRISHPWCTLLPPSFLFFFLSLHTRNFVPAGSVEAGVFRLAVLQLNALRGTPSQGIERMTYLSICRSPSFSVLLGIDCVIFSLAESVIRVNSPVRRRASIPRIRR